MDACTSPAQVYFFMRCFVPGTGWPVYYLIMSHHHSHSHSSVKHGAGKPSPTFSKVFRWHPAKPGDPLPASVEVVGSFTEWKPVALVHDRASRAWHLTLHHLPGNRTHNYMLLVDGQPANDRHCDGLSVPHTVEEKQYQLMTPRGPRVFMLFSQTK